MKSGALTLSMFVWLAGCTDGSKKGPVTTKATIGSGGGMLASDDGILSLQIPAGAVAADTTFSIVATSNMFGAGGVGVALGQAYEIEPSGTMFTVPVQLVFSLADAAGATTNAAVVAMARSGSTDESLITVVDLSAKQAIGYSTHLSTFGLAQTAPAQQLCDCSQNGCFTSCCNNSTGGGLPGNSYFNNGQCFCTVGGPASALTRAFWQQWACYNNCAGAAAPEKTTVCTACIAGCFEAANGTISSATATQCTGVTSGADLTALKVCLDDCHHRGLDQPTTMCGPVAAPGPNNSPRPSRCGPKHCSITLSGDLNQSYDCSGGKSSFFMSSDSSQLFAFLDVGNLLTNDQGVNIQFLGPLPGVPGPGTYDTPTISGRGIAALLSSGIGSGAGPLNLNCVGTSGVVTDTSPLYGAGTITIPVDKKNITVTADFAF